MSHAQTVIRRPTFDGGNEEVEVDEKLAPFLSMLWEHSIDTMMSCQDNPEGSEPPHFLMYSFSPAFCISSKSSSSQSSSGLHRQ